MTATPEQRAEVLAGLREVWAEEEARRASPNARALVDSLLDSDDPRVAKVTAQYDRGLLSWAEFEWKVTELLTARGDAGA